MCICGTEQNLGKIRGEPRGQWQGSFACYLCPFSFKVYNNLKSDAERFGSTLLSRRPAALAKLLLSPVGRAAKAEVTHETDSHFDQRMTAAACAFVIRRACPCERLLLHAPPGLCRIPESESTSLSKSGQKELTPGNRNRLIPILIDAAPFTIHAFYVHGGPCGCGPGFVGRNGKKPHVPVSDLKFC